MTRLGIVAEAFADRPLDELCAWLAAAAPAACDLELGCGGYAPTTHCDRQALLADAGERRRYLTDVERHGQRVAALNVWGNPLHPDASVARRHDADLREAVRLAKALGVERLVALAGCPAGAPGDVTPHVAAGGWLPYLEGRYDEQWRDAGAPYWADVAAFARREHPSLLICVELHPGTLVYNVETFERLAALGDNLRANLDPSHFLWQGMDTLAIIERLGDRIAHAHAKDVVRNPAALALNGPLDHRWPAAGAEGSWRFATVGHGQDAGWWQAVLAALEGTATATVAIEHEDPLVAASDGVVEAAALLCGSLAGVPS